MKSIIKADLLSQMDRDGAYIISHSLLADNMLDCSYTANTPSAEQMSAVILEKIRQILKHRL